MTGQTWRKSTASNGTNCAEVATWRTATDCTGGECAEVAASGAGVLVRDSQLADGSPVLRFSGEAWAAFLATLKRHQDRDRALCSTSGEPSPTCGLAAPRKT